MEDNEPAMDRPLAGMIDKLVVAAMSQNEKDWRVMFGSFLLIEKRIKDICAHIDMKITGNGYYRFYGAESYCFVSVNSNGIWVKTGNDDDTSTRFPQEYLWTDYIAAEKELRDAFFAEQENRMKTATQRREESERAQYERLKQKFGE